MKKLQLLILALIMFSNFLKSQPTSEIENAFQSSASIFNIPVDLLKAVSFVETRFNHLVPSEDSGSCSDIPNSYGVMGLKNDDWFGNSLLEAAALINETPQMLKLNFELNIRGASALLSKYAGNMKINRDNLNSWKIVLEKYSGIPQEDVKEFYSFDVFKVLSEGTNTNGIKINRHSEIDMSIFSDEVNPKNKLKNIESEDYGPATWDPSPNYTSNSITQLFAVVHDTEGSFAGSLSWLKNPAAQASSHYIIRSSDGYIVQLVREQNKAWHAVCWNGYMLGVEHEGFVSTPAYYTEAMYQSSAALFKHFATKFSIPIDRFHIVSHQEWQNNQWKSWMQTNYPGISTTCNTHTDPGKYWKWDHYISLISDQDSEVISGFEFVVNPWWSPTTSGSTYGISNNSTFAQTSETKKSGTYSGKLLLQDSTQNSNWFVRVYYNYPSNDTLKLGTTGYLRIYLKTASIPQGLKIRLAVDDNAGNITEATSWQSVISDATWHLYEWKIDDPSQWDNFSNGNGQIDGPNTYFDSIQFSCSDPNSGSTQYAIYIDNIEKGTQPLNVISLNLTTFLEGFYNNSISKATTDTINVLLKNIISPFTTVDSAKAYLDSLGRCAIKFVNAQTGSYYIVLKHRNHLETWSKSGGENLVKGILSTYNFTDNSSKAYGNNMKLSGTKWCIFAGDVNQDGIVDLTDLSMTDIDNINLATGYRSTDENGDGIIDLSDLSLVDNNNLLLISKIIP